MAEVKKEKQHISLNICDERFDIYVMPDAEGYYRDAEKLVQTTYGRFADRFRGQKSERFIAAAALLEMAVKYQMEHASKDVDSYNNLLQRLTSEIDEALK